MLTSLMFTRTLKIKKKDISLHFTECILQIHISLLKRLKKEH